MNRDPVGNTHELAEALIRLGTLLKDPDACTEDLAAAALACGLRLQVRVVPLEPSPPEPHQHVWAYSMGDTHERCVLCGEQRAVGCIQGYE